MAKDNKYAKSLFFVLIDEFRLYIRGVTEYEYYPNGIAIAVLLLENDARMRTWPEKDIIDIDISYSDESENSFIEKLIDSVKYIFHPRSILYSAVNRNDMKVILEDRYDRT